MSKLSNKPTNYSPPYPPSLSFPPMIPLKINSSKWVTNSSTSSKSTRSNTTRQYRELRSTKIVCTSESIQIIIFCCIMKAECTSVDGNRLLMERERNQAMVFSTSRRNLSIKGCLAKEKEMDQVSSRCVTVQEKLLFISDSSQTVINMVKENRLIKTGYAMKESGKITKDKASENQY